MTAMATMQAQKAPRRALKRLMQDLSDEHYAAGWLKNPSQ